MLGCQMAGLCFSNTGLGLVHSLAQPMGGRCHVPHGLANAICLATVMRYTLPAVPEAKTFRIAKALDIETRGMEKTDCEAAIVTALDRLAKRLHIPDIATAGVTREAILAMSGDALLELSTPTAPRKATAEEVAALYEELFAEAGAGSARTVGDKRVA
jgi:alcohol dehydrogenase class IV